MRTFNTTGPCFPGKHYMLPPEDRIGDVRRLIDGESYFVIHAARQTGKTTLLKSLARDLNAVGRMQVLYCSLETARVCPSPADGIPAILDCLRLAAEVEPAVAAVPFPARVHGGVDTQLLRGLRQWCAALPKPLAVFFDEADALSEETLLSFLSQLRNGYVNRDLAPFPVSVALVGMRNLRDYRARIRSASATLGSTSPFNVIVKALTLRNFAAEEIGRLYAQHTAEGGHVFPPETVTRVWERTQGQPWLVNAVAREAVEELLAGRPRQDVQPALTDEAIERIILRRDTHVDSLLERLREDRVRRIVEPTLLGEDPAWNTLEDDVQYVLDLGLLYNDRGVLAPANPVYGEIIARVLSWGGQEALGRLSPEPAAPLYVTDGRFDMGKLLRAFQEFWRENSEAWAQRFDYREAAPHLILMAYLQRVVNGGGRIEREFALGRGRIDLLVEFMGGRFPVEIKVRRGERSTAEGLRQLGAYMVRLDAAEGWLVLFDRRPGIDWDSKLTWHDKPLPDGRTVHVVGC